MPTGKAPVAKACLGGCGERRLCPPLALVALVEMVLAYVDLVEGLAGGAAEGGPRAEG